MPSGDGIELASCLRYTGIPVYSHSEAAMLQVQDQSIRPLTTAHLAQTMTLLALSNLELRDKVLGELANNPALELLEDRVCPACHRHLPQPGPCPACSRPQAEDGPIVFLSPRESSFPRHEAT